MSTAHKTRRILAALLIVPLFSSCFTTALWNGGFGPDASLEEDDSGEEYVLAKILLSPLALLLDMCTAPLQSWWSDDEHDDHHHHDPPFDDC